MKSENRWRWLALTAVVGTALFAYSFWPRSVKSVSSENRSEEFAEYLYGLEMRVEFGNHTDDDVRIAHEKLYEIVEDLGSLEVVGIEEGSHNVGTMGHNLSSTYIVSRTYSHDLMFVDFGSNGLVFGTPDYIVVSDSFDLFETDRKKYSFAACSGMSPEQWRSDIEDLVVDYDFTLVLFYMKLLQHSDNGTVKIGLKRYDLLD